MRLITAYTIPCRKSGKNHKHWISFNIYSYRKQYYVSCEESKDGEEIILGDVAIFFTEKMARSFCDFMFKSISTDLEKFDIKKLRLRGCRR